MKKVIKSLEYVRSELDNFELDKDGQILTGIESSIDYLTTHGRSDKQDYIDTIRHTYRIPKNGNLILGLQVLAHLDDLKDCFDKAEVNFPLGLDSEWEKAKSVIETKAPKVYREFPFNIKGSQ